MSTSPATPRGPFWGCIADDITGATDLATNFVGQGLRTAVFFEAADPDAIAALPDLDVAVIALKSRTAPVDDAVRESLQALGTLKRAGASRFYFKYCSTFDSTSEGNIGPVIDALLDALGDRLTIVVPSFPDAGRTVYMGHLFVGSQLLSDSPMRDHPLTPMRDSDVLQLLAPQTAGKVDLIPLPVVRNGASAIRRELSRIGARGSRTAVVIDAVDRADLAAIMTAAADLPLITGSSGLAQGAAPAEADGRAIPLIHGRRVILCGSVSARTREQIAEAREVLPWTRLDAGELGHGAAGEVERVVAWAQREWEHDADAVPLIFAADSLTDVNSAEGDNPLSALIERALGAISVALVAEGARQMIIAGGETSGQVLQDLGVSALRIGPEIAAGVTWSVGRTSDDVPVLLALKSGNFGTPDMFLTAWQCLPAESGVVK